MIPPTGIETVDRILEQHAPFGSVEEAEATARWLMAVWHMLHSSGLEDAVTLSQRRQRR